MIRTRLIVLATLAALVVGTVALAGVAWAESGAPRVVRTVPPDGATGVDITANIKAKFSEAMKARSINESTFYLLQGHFSYDDINGCTGPGPLAVECPPVPVAATVRYNAETRTAILDPTNPLLCSTEYTALVEGTGDGDMQAVKDRGGTPMATDYIFHFTTGLSSGGNPCPF
jgi:hypothetical protein